MNIFCFGFGQVAKSFVRRIKSENFSINLSTTTTDKTSQKSINGITYKNYFFKNEIYDPDLVSVLKKADHILISIPPINGVDKVIANFSNTLKNCKPKWITYLSATSVYGDHKGEWVNEKSKTHPSSSNGLARLEAEKSWLTFSLNHNLPIQVFRLSGIYSNESNILLRLKSGDAKLIKKQNHFFSRIHLDDIKNILFKSLTKFAPGEIYNISDDRPSSSEEVTLYALRLLKMSKFEITELKDIDSQMLRNFYKDSKKVSNKKTKFFFDYDLTFPTYVEGLTYINDNFI